MPAPFGRSIAKSLNANAAWQTTFDRSAQKKARRRSPRQKHQIQSTSLSASVCASSVMSYRLAPANPWPSGARDVAAATSWLHQNVDVFGGNRDEIVVVGYSVGAFHVASLLAHPEFQITDSGIAAAVLVSGIYRAGADANADEKSYFGADASQYDQRIGVPRNPEYQHTVAARLVDAGCPTPRRRGRNAETTPMQLRGPLPAHNRAWLSRKPRFRV